MILTNHTHNISLDFDLGNVQNHENMAVVPVITNKNPKLDLLTLKKGLELDLVEVKELDESTVNTISVKNDAVTPLIIFNGEEIIGSKQNRIINNTMVLAPKSINHVEVSCTEQGRWEHITPTFKQSEYMANFKTRQKKEVTLRKYDNCQSEVWNSISSLECDHSFSSPTKAMSESYDNLKANHDEFLNAFSIEKNQIGVVVILDGEIKGFELFYSHPIYKEYHEKILRSYLIDNENKNPVFTVNTAEVEALLLQAMDSSFSEKESKSLENILEFENDYGIGTLYAYENEVVHWSFFKKQELKDEEEVLIDDMEDITV